MANACRLRSLSTSQSSGASRPAASVGQRSELRETHGIAAETQACTYCETGTLEAGTNTGTTALLCADCGT